MRYLGLLICTLTSVFCFTSVGYAHTQTQKITILSKLSELTQDKNNHTVINLARSVGKKVRLRHRRT